MVFLSMEDFLEIGIVQITYFAQKMKFSIMNLCSKCEQICRKLRIWLPLLKKFWMESFIFFVRWYVRKRDSSGQYTPLYKLSTEYICPYVPELLP